MTNGQKIKINGVEHDLDNLSDEAKGQLTNLRVTDQEIARLQTQLAIFQTARAAYARALGAALPSQIDTQAAEVGKNGAKKAPDKNA